MPGPASSRPGSSSRRGRRPAAGAASPYAERPWLSSYPPGVPADVEVPEVPLTRLLDDAAASWPTATALAFQGTRISYRELQAAVDAFAAALAGLGVGKGDRVAVVLPNCPQNVIATYATLRLGAVVVQHNPLYTEPELRHQLVDCGATVVVCLDRVYGSVARVRPDTAVQHVVVTSLADYLPPVARLTLRLPVRRARRARAELLADLPKGAPVQQFLAMIRAAGLPARQAPIDPVTDLALLQYTGGTTGASKGAMLTHHNLVANAYMNRLWDTEAVAGREVCLAVLPLFHAYGLTVCMNATLLLGGTLVLLPRFDLDLVFAAIDQWKPTMLPGVPPIYKALSDSPKAASHDLHSIRVCVSGAMKLTAEIQEQFERISGSRLVEGYGLTETSPSTHCNPITGLRKIGSIGVPLPGTHARVVDRDDSRREVPPGQPGELAVGGPQVFRGYWGREGLPGIFTDDGYLLTGDIAVMDDDGFFRIVDRKKELIIAGGFNIYPSEVEEVLLDLDGVADAVVAGVPDRYRGETVKAFVVRAPGSDLTADDVVAHCATALTTYKVPRIVEFREDLPRTPVGKVLRRVLLEQGQGQPEQEAAAALPARKTAAGRAAASPAKKAEAKKAEGKKAAAKKATGAKKAAAKKATGAKKDAAKKATGAKKDAAKKATGARGTAAGTTGARVIAAGTTGARATGARGTGARATGAEGTAARSTAAKAAPLRKSGPTSERSDPT